MKCTAQHSNFMALLEINVLSMHNGHAHVCTCAYIHVYACVHMCLHVCVDVCTCMYCVYMDQSAGRGEDVVLK